MYAGEEGQENPEILEESNQTEVLDKIFSEARKVYGESEQKDINQ